jgi:hypothetical protein
MKKPRCPYYPKEKAQRHCPVLNKAISSRACQEKYCIEIKCENCIYITKNIEVEETRLFRRQTGRLRAEFGALDISEERINQIMVFLRMEALVARYAQWYPMLTDEDVLAILQTMLAELKAFRAGLEYEADHLPGSADELLQALKGRFGMVDMVKERNSNVMPVYLDVMIRVVEMLMASFARHRASDPRSYIQFILQFVDKEPPKPVADRLLINPEDDSLAKRIILP